MFSKTNFYNRFGARVNSKQAGAVLIVSLCILLLISILGISTIQTATYEERMAANARSKDIAFQAAEAALVSAENAIDSLTGVAGFTSTCINGLCTPLDSSSTSERWEDGTLCSNAGIWDCGSVALSDASFTSTGSPYAAAPRYFVELLTSYYPGGGSLNMYNYGNEITNTEVTVFRVTALGYGGSTDVKVILQSTFAKKF